MSKFVNCFMGFKIVCVFNIFLYNIKGRILAFWICFKRGKWIMAIYKSSYNQKPEKEQKPKKEKVKLPKEVKPRRVKIRPSLVSLLVSILLFVVCCFPSNFLKNFLLGAFGLLSYPVLFLVAFFLEAIAR